MTENQPKSHKSDTEKKNRTSAADTKTWLKEPPDTDWNWVKQST